MEHQDEMRELGHAIRVAGFVRDYATLVTLQQQAEESDHPMSEGWIELSLWFQLRIRGEIDAAKEHIDSATYFFEDHDDAFGLCAALSYSVTIAILNNELERAAEMTARSLELAEACEYPFGRALALVASSFVNQQRREIADSIGDLERALRILVESGFERETSVVHKFLARAFMQTGAIVATREDVQLAVSHANQSIDMAETSGDQFVAASSLSVLGMINSDLGDVAEAVVCFHKALTLIKSGTSDTSDPERVMLEVETYARLAQVHQRVRNLETAQAYLLRAQAISTNSRMLAQIWFSLGINSVWSGDPEQAVEYYSKALPHIQKEIDDVSRGFVHTNLAHAHLELGNIEDARRELELAASASLMHAQLTAWFAIVNCRLRVIDGELDESKETLTGTLAAVSSPDTLWEQIEVHLVLRDIALKQNDLAEYVKQNDLVQRLTEEQRGPQKLQALALTEQEAAITKEREKERAVLYSTLPQSVADRIIRGETVNNDQYDDAVVIFLDIAGFTKISSTIPPGHVVHLLDAIFNACDDVVEKHGVTKIKTIGDSYMAAAFPDVGDRGSGNSTAQRAAAAALDLLDAMDTLQVTMPTHLGDNSWVDDIPHIDVRIGIHVGPVVAGVIGSKRLQYDVWGDTVNVASRMESTGEPGRIQVSSDFHEQLRDRVSPLTLERGASEGGGVRFRTAERGTIEVKGKGTMTTYWLERG